MSERVLAVPATKKNPRGERVLQISLLNGFGEMLVYSEDPRKTYEFGVSYINDGWADQHTLDAMAIMLELFTIPNPPHEKVMRHAILNSPSETKDPTVLAYASYLHGLRFKIQREYWEAQSG
jgi:hypothetical protein